LSGIGVPTDSVVRVDPVVLEADCLRSNMSLIRELRADPHADELLRLTEMDVEAGRMSELVPGMAVGVAALAAWVAFVVAALDCDLAGVKLHPRFGVEQGMRCLGLHTAVTLCVPGSHLAGLMVQ